jgi:hypothetical protein
METSGGCGCSAAEGIFGVIRMSFHADEWHAFVEAIKKDEFRFE